MRTRVLAWVAVAAAVVGSLGIAAFGDTGPRTREERIRAVAETIRCPACAGQSVADSDTPASRNIRTDIARRISEGESDDQIRAAIADRFTDVVLLEPGRSGLAGAVWAIPVLALVVALAGLAAVFARWRRTPVVTASAQDRTLVDDARRGP
ncbi:MAG: cytochrome c-type biogenesis protein CcmH [Acidimicrobiia bacterium]